MGKRYPNTGKNKFIPMFFTCFIVFFTILFTIFYFNETFHKISDSSASITDTKDDSKVSSTPVIPAKDTAEQQNITVPPAKESIVITAVGDCTLGTDSDFSKSTSLPVVVQQHNNDSSYLFGNVYNILKADDITIANLETTFTTSNNPRDKQEKVQFNFKGDPSLAKSLTAASIEGVNLSNNHIYDYGDEGFNDTIKTLKENNIAFFGENNIWMTEAHGIKFGFLGYKGWSSSSDVLKKIKSDVSDLKSKVDIVITIFHWGKENSYTPDDTQKKLAHYAVDSGADLVIGHHPHVIEGIENYKGKYICYSLGNFCFGGNSNPNDKDTFIFQANFKFEASKLKEVGIKAIPCRVSSVSNYNDYKPTPLSGDERLRLLRKLNSLCINLGYNIDDNFKFTN